jgi:hypothetical protein
LLKSGIFALVLGAACLLPAAVLGQAANVVLVPYGEPGTKDPHAAQITDTLAAALQKAGAPVKIVAPIDHLDAVANAAQICRDNGATSLLIPEGRYEQTQKVIRAVLTTVYTYPTHVELRLDRIDCAGRVVWSATATKDIVRSNGIIQATNIGATIDDAFRDAVATVVSQLVSAPAIAAVPTAVPAAAAVPTAVAATAAATADGPQTYLIVPFGQPGIGDPRSKDLTGSLSKYMTDRKLAVKVAQPADRLTLVKDAGTMCSQNAATAILVPDLRLEQGPTKTHAELRLVLLGCDGRPKAHAFAETDVGNGFANFNPGAVMVNVGEQATKPALDRLFPGTTPAPAASR